MGETLFVHEWKCAELIENESLDLRLSNDLGLVLVGIERGSHSNSLWVWYVVAAEVDSAILVSRRLLAWTVGTPIR